MTYRLQITVYNVKDGDTVSAFSVMTDMPMRGLHKLALGMMDDVTQYEAPPPDPVQAKFYNLYLTTPLDLLQAAGKMIYCIKTVREHTNLGLKDAKDLVESERPTKLGGVYSWQQVMEFQSALLVHANAEAHIAEVEFENGN